MNTTACQANKSYAIVEEKTVLILTSNPKNTTQLRIGTEIREIEESLKRAKYGKMFKLYSKHAVRLKDLRRAILDIEPNIVHFCGHGTVDGICLEDETGYSKLVESDAIGNLFSLFNDHIEVVILNSCYSEKQAEQIALHIDYVIGMKKDIEDVAAIEFSIGFYDALGIGKRVPKAFEFGVNAIKLHSLSDDLTPRLFWQPSILNTDNKIKDGFPEERIQLIIKEKLVEFDYSKQENIRIVLSAFLGVPVEEIAIYRLMKGSVQIILKISGDKNRILNRISENTSILKDKGIIILKAESIQKELYSNQVLNSNLKQKIKLFSELKKTHKTQIKNYSDFIFINNKINDIINNWLLVGYSLENEYIWNKFRAVYEKHYQDLRNNAFFAENSEVHSKSYDSLEYFLTFYRPIRVINELSDKLNGKLYSKKEIDSKTLKDMISIFKDLSEIKKALKIDKWGNAIDLFFYNLLTVFREKIETIDFEVKEI